MPSSWHVHALLLTVSKFSVLFMSPLPCQTDSVSQVWFGDWLSVLWGHDSGLALCISSLRSSRSKSLRGQSPTSLAPSHMPQSHLPLS